MSFNLKFQREFLHFNYANIISLLLTEIILKIKNETELTEKLKYYHQWSGY